ncbi:MAG: hypothetical protein Kow0031_01280 [Anaerolineae bacterium]
MTLLKRHPILAGLIVMVVLLAGCGPFNPGYRQNNPVRLAVFQYEVEQRGYPDDLLLHFYRTEPRVKFQGQAENGGRTIWLFDLAAREYFDLLPPGRSYMYVQEIQFNPERTQATVEVYRGDTSGYQGHTLSLSRNADDTWQVTDDVAIADTPQN